MSLNPRSDPTDTDVLRTWALIGDSCSEKVLIMQSTKDISGETWTH